MNQKGITMERQRGFETRRLITVMILFCALAIPLFAVTGCGKQLARMEENQVKLQAMVAANARELATISSQLHTGQGKINESIQALDGDTRQVAAGVVSVQNQQRQLHDAVAAGNEGLHRRIGYVEDNQRSLQGSVSQVSDVTQRTAADLTSLAREHAVLHETVRSNQQELADRFGTVVDNQQRIQTGIGDLRQASVGLTQDIASVAARNDTLYATMRDNNKQLADRLASLASGHEQVCANIANVHTLLQTMATDLVAANSSLKEQMGTNHQTLTTQITGLSASQQHLQAGVDALGGKADQTVADLADTRSSLQDTLRVSREVLTGQMAASLQNQQALHSDVRDLNEKADKLTANIGEMATEQTGLRETLRTNHDAVVTAMAGVSDSHEALRRGIGKLDSKTDRAAGDLASMATQQQSLYEAVKANHDAVATRLADVAATTSQTARDVAALNDGQAELQQNVKTGNVVLTARATELAANQQTFKSGIESLGHATQRVACDLATLAAAQDVLRQALKTHGDKTSGQATALANIQEQMKANLDTLTAMTGQASLDILALGNNQTGLAQTVKTGVADLGARTDKIASQLTAVAAGQNSLNDTLNRHGQAVSGQMAKIADGQQQIQEGMDTLTATTGQTGLDIIAMTARQDAIRAALQSHSETVGTQMAKLADNQQQIQSGLDTVTATAGQASLDTLALNKSQGQLGQAVQTGRQEMVSTLAAMSQSQQSWSERLDAAQAKVTTIADSIAALERQIANLQGVLQTGIQGTAAMLGTTGQQRQQFEVKVGQDMQAVIDSLAQLRQTQASLQEQIAQVQKSTQGQTESLRSVIEQIKTTPNVSERVREQGPNVQERTDSPEPKQANTEVRISAAAEVPQTSEIAEMFELPEATE